MSKYVGKIITNQAPAGYSVYFDGTGDNLSLGTAAALNFGTSNFTVDFWYYPTAIGVYTTILASGNATFGSGAVVISGGSTTANAMRFGAFDFGGTYQIVSDPAITPTNTWTHYALTRSGNTFTLYRNGVSVATNTWTGSVNFNFNSSTKIGGGTWDGASSFITGNISNLRAINGTALYTVAFTPPTQLLNVTNTSLLTCNSPAIVDQSSNAFAITVNGNSAVSTFTPFTAYNPYNPALGASTPGVWTLDEAMQAAATRQWNMYDPYFQNTTLLLHGNGTNAAQNNTFLDSSSNNFTITRNGNTTQGSFSPFSLQPGTWSNYFNGSSYLTTASNAAFQFGTGDFTMECWINMAAGTSLTSYWRSFLSCAGDSASVNGVTLYIADAASGSSVAGEVAAILGNDSIRIYGGQDIRGLGWVHVALTRSGTTVRLFVNGVQRTSATNSSNITGTSYGAQIGLGILAQNNYFVGYVSNVRVVKGTALYTADFTPSVAPLTAVVNTSLLTCQSNRFVDNSSNGFTLTPSGTPSVQAFSPFYPTAAYTPQTIGGSGYFDGSGDYLTVGSSSAFNLPGDFTMEAWCYFTSRNASYTSVIQYNTTVYLGTEGTQATFYADTPTAIYLKGGTIQDNAWNHIAIARSGSTVRLWLNGASVASATNSGTIGGTTPSLWINSGNSGTSYQSAGYYNGVRIVKGTAVYDPTQTSITVPTAPPTAITNTSLLLNFTNAGIVDSTAKNVLETVGNAQISTAQSKFGGSSMYFDGTGDYLLISQNNQSLMLGTAPFTIEFWFNTTSSTQYAQFVGNETTTNGFTILINVASATAGTVAVYNGAAGQIHISTSSYRDGAWHHFALSRDSSGSRMFIDGTQIGSTNTGQASANFDASSFRWAIGANLKFTGRDYAGYIDDLRITKLARYTANFTPQTSQWQDQ